MDTALSHYTIDDHLKRYKEALVHLTKCAPTKSFEDVVAYVRKHELYREAMQLYKEDREQYDALLGHYADYLADNGQAKEAGLGIIPMFCYANE